MTKQVTLSAGTVEYGDSGGDGPVVVLCHGLLMDRTVWDMVLPVLTPIARVITPTLPAGSHRIPMRPDADLSLNGQAAILSDFLKTLGLTDVTLVVSDLGYPLLLAAAGHPAITRLAILPCELYDNIPPGLPGKIVNLAARAPGGIYMSVQSLVFPGAARLPITFGRMANRVSRRMLKDWTAGPRRSREIRRDVIKYIKASDLADLDIATQQLSSFGRPTAIIWSRRDKVMPHAHAARLAQSMPDAELITLETGYTLLQLDHPQAVAQQLKRLISSPTLN